MRTLSQLITRIHTQLRLTPLISDDDIVGWISRAVDYICTRSVFLVDWTIVVAKDDVERYLLPADHIATMSLHYDGVRMQTCNAFDANLVSVSTPVYFHEDEWQHEASMASENEFIKQYTLNELWPLQMMRSQNTYGRKTFTSVGAPTSDGETTPDGVPVVGALFGTHDDDAIHWPNPLGAPYFIATHNDNFLLIYRFLDRRPESTDDDIEWTELMAALYTLKSCSLALETEDDEYDRYSAWMYNFMTDSLTNMLRTLGITRRFP